MTAVAKPITTEFGHSLPPEGPHTITLHVPGWDSAIRFREGDASLFARLRSIYPRFGPFGPARQLSAALGRKLGAVPGKDGLVMFTDPGAFAAHREFSTSHHRKEHRLADGDISFRVVDVRGVRLYCVVYPLAKAPGVIGVWQNAGTGLSSRASEDLLGHVDGRECSVVEWSGDLADVVPPPTYLPECEAHAALRRRIRDLLHRSPVDPEKVKVGEGDVFLYQTGMAAIYRLNEVLLERDSGTVLVLGSVFHNTFHLFDELPGGMKHFGACDAESGVMTKVEEYLAEHYKKGNTVSSVFLEMPSNPILVSADIKTLREIADKYSFPMVIDDTIGSFANIDVLPVADIVVTSLTKSFSGYADVMGGSVVLNPVSALYPQIQPLLAASFHNELFAGDAAQLLANSADYLARSAVLNRNAQAVATHLAAVAAPPVRAVLYPSVSDTRQHYDAFMRPATPSFAPGYGCLLAVDFETLDAAVAFYDGLAMHKGPHLGAHRALALPMIDLAFGKNPEEARYHASYGARAEQVRISVGLEEAEELVAAVQVALDKATEVYRRGGRLNGTDAGEAVADEAVAGGEETNQSEADVKAAASATSANYD